jgi:hypothetical protein
MNPVHTTPSFFSRIHFNIIHSHLGLPSGLFSYGFPIKTLYAFISICSHPCNMPCPSHLSSLDHSNYILRRVQVMKFLIKQFFLQHPIISSLFGSNFLLNTLFSNTISLCSSFISETEFHTQAKLHEKL